MRKRGVDATYLAPTIPATTPPPFGVADDVDIVPVNQLARLETVRDRAGEQVPGSGAAQGANEMRLARRG